MTSRAGPAAACLREKLNLPGEGSKGDLRGGAWGDSQGWKAADFPDGGVLVNAPSHAPPWGSSEMTLRQALIPFVFRITNLP